MMTRKPYAREDWCGYQRAWYKANKKKILAKKRQRYAIERAGNTARYHRTLLTSYFGNRLWRERQMAGANE